MVNATVSSFVVLAKVRADFGLLICDCRIRVLKRHFGGVKDRVACHQALTAFVDDRGVSGLWILHLVGMHRSCVGLYLHCVMPGTAAFNIVVSDDGFSAAWAASKPQGVNPLNGIRRILVQVEAAGQPNRIGRYESSASRIVVSSAVVVQPCLSDLRRSRRSREPQSLTRQSSPASHLLRHRIFS